MKQTSNIYNPEFSKDGELFFLKKNTNEVIGKIDIEISYDEAEAETGMMHRNILGEDQGMLFILEKNIERSFWMKNTLIPLDIIFADSSKQIFKIYKEAKPLSEELIHSDKPVKCTIEVKAGYCERLGIQEGDTIRYIKI